MIEENDLYKLFGNLPYFLQEYLNDHSNKEKLIEIVMDLGRRPEAHFITGPEYLSQKIVSWQDIDYTTKRISKFSNENRAGIERTLHRISCIRNRQFLINGLTCRVGRVIFGTISSIRDLLESGQSILLLGKPGVGKTTIIREIARVLSDEMEKRVIIIDTSNEIGGDSDVPHSGIGRARRMQVAKSELQHQIMIEAVENHMPQVIIIDEIGTELEVLAARTIAEKGVQLVGTTHGNSLENLIKNPPLSDLIGGIQYVTLSDDEAKKRGTQKSILERKSYPAFQIVVEINEQNSWTIHEDVKSSIDLLLRGSDTIMQIRQLSRSDKTNIEYKKFRTNSFFVVKNFNNFKSQISLPYSSWIALNQINYVRTKDLKTKKLFIYIYSLPSNLIREIIGKMQLQFMITKEIKKASIILALKKCFDKNIKLRRLARENKIPIYLINKCSNVYEVFFSVKLNLKL